MLFLETRWWANTGSNLCLTWSSFWCWHYPREHCWWVQLWWQSVRLLCWCGQRLSTVPCLLSSSVSWWSRRDDQVELHLPKPDNIWSGKTQYFGMSRSVIFRSNFKLKTSYFVVSNYLNSLAKCPPKPQPPILFRLVFEDYQIGFLVAVIEVTHNIKGMFYKIWV